MEILMNVITSTITALLVVYGYMRGANSITKTKDVMTPLSTPRRQEQLKMPTASVAMSNYTASVESNKKKEEDLKCIAVEELRTSIINFFNAGNYYVYSATKEGLVPSDIEDLKKELVENGYEVHIDSNINHSLKKYISIAVIAN